ncbi:MAG: cytochrome b [Proteobacteria bacterium]|nr:cytochrome b [Pseudomonadota bacterium]
MSEPRYSAAARSLHWLTVLLIIAVYMLGSQLEHPPEGWGDTLYRLHWSVGLTILAVTVFRLANRILAGAPPPYTGLTNLELRLSTAVHHGLYLMLFVAPLLGWLGKSAYGGAISVFGLFNMPALISQQDEATAKTLLGVHKIAVKLLLLLIALHVAGALNHILIKKDGVFARMWPRD